MKSRFASITVNFFLIFSIFSLLNFVRANNGYNPHTSFVQCPPPPPCICTPTSPNIQPPPSPSTVQPLLPPAATPQPAPTTQPSLPPPPSQQTTPPPPHITVPVPPAVPLSPPPLTTPPQTLSSGGICIRNDTELQICANIVSIADGLLTTGRAEPCCSIVRNLSDVDAVTCLCKSVGARPLSLSPNFGIFFRVCGRRIPQGFSCPGPSPTIPQPPPSAQLSPPPQTTPPPLPSTTLPPPPLTPFSSDRCPRNDTDLQICANIVSIADGLLTTGRAEPCCSIVRNLSDVDAVTCLCKSVGAKPFSLSPNFGIFFRVCGRRIPQGFSCPGPSPTIPQPPPNAQSPPPPQTTPPPPPSTTLPPPPLTPFSDRCPRNDTDLQICANIVSIADGLLTTGRAEPCCSIVRNLSDVDAVTCLCKSVGAKPFSLSPNFGIFFRVCGRRIPQGFSCPGLSPTIPQPLPNAQSPPPPKTIPTSPPSTTLPPPSLKPFSGGICTRNDKDLQICANIVSIADGLLTTGRAEPCCSIVRNLSDVDAVTCLCKSVGAKPSSLSPNFGIFFRVCGRRIPQGFSCS